MDKITTIFSKNQGKLAFAIAAATVLGGSIYVYAKKVQSESQSKCQKKKNIEQQPLVDLGQNRFLTQAMAQHRAEQIVKHSLEYVVHLLIKKGEMYEALVNLKFGAVHCNTDLYMDYRGTELLGLQVNGITIAEPQWNKLFIILPKQYLKHGQEQNEIRLRIRSKYQSDGTGLHSFTDVDGKQYLYSQGESYFCNRFFPCMDQPDLKGTLQFKIVAPQEWKVISNENETLSGHYDYGVFNSNHNQEHSNEWFESVFNNLDENQYQFIVYNKTPKLPSYLYCVIAGEYWSIKDDQPGISQTIYCRESLKEHMLKLKDFVFEVTRESMKFYEQFFGVPYQFSKYDSIFCAEYNWGAMENPGCVTFNDLYVFKEQKEATRYTQLANTIAHEMAHHWFGDYVTMRWWNDLWLNESYADFISHFCLENLNIKSIKLTNIGVMFNSRKGWGYREDQMVTTHPIAGEVKNTEVAENVFDGITYSKGASVMKQLMYIIGSEGFGKACGEHFKKFAWDNATLEDLIQSLQGEFFKKNLPFTLQQWQEQWIQKAGLNEVLPEWDPKDLSQNATLKLHQSPALAEFPTLRKHKVKVAFFTEHGEIVPQDILIDNTQVTEVNYDGSKNYKAVLVNYEDHSFLKVLLDDISLAFFKDRLHTINDTLTRQLIWRAFFDNVRDGKIPSDEYVEIVLNNCTREVSDEILSTQLLYLQSALFSMTPRKFRKVLSHRVFEFLLNYLKHIATDLSAENKNRIVMFRDKLIGFTCDDNDIDTVLAWYHGKIDGLQSVELSISNKWSLVNLIHSSKKYSNDIRNEIFTEVEALDKSDTRLHMRKTCNALLLTPEERKQVWDSFLDINNKESARLQSYTMHGFNDSRRFEELQVYQDLFFEVLVEVFQKRSTDFAKEFYHSLFPITDDLAYINRKLSELLGKLPQGQVTLQISIKKSIDDINKKVRQFECFGHKSKLVQHQEIVQE